MDEQRLQEIEAWINEAACFSECDEHDEATLWSLIAEVRRLRECPPDATGYWPDHIRAIADQRDAALAEREHERLRYDGMRSDRDDWRKRCEDEQAAHALTADRYVGANRRGDELRAALTEARRLLQSALPHVGRIWHGSDAPPPVYIEELRARIAAVLAQEEK